MGNCCSDANHNTEIQTRTAKETKPMRVFTTNDEDKPETFGKALNPAFIKPDNKVKGQIGKYQLYKFENSGADLKGTELNPVKKGENEEGVYEGQVLGAKRHGKGHLLTKEGDLFVCPFYEDLAHGTGVAYFANGNYFSGKFFKGDLENGKMIYPDGSVYIGEFINGKRNGKGSILYADSKMYEGFWVDDKEHGQGKVVTEGVWEKGQMKQVSKVTPETFLKSNSKPATTPSPADTQPQAPAQKEKGTPAGVNVGAQAGVNQPARN